MLRHFFTAFILCITVAAAAVSAQEATPTPTPAQPPVNDTQKVAPEDISGVPAIAPDYKYEDRELPELGRVGVDMADQRPLTLQESITLALENNRDIEVTRKNLRIAEFDLKAAKGVYEPRFFGDVHYERAKTPVFSFFGGGPDGSLTQTNIVGSAGIQGMVRNTGGNFSVQTDQGRNTTNNLFSLVNPTLTSNLRFAYTQPIFRGLRFDQQRRSIEIAKRNIELSDTQFRQRSVEIIAQVQRAYWDLTYALRNLQVQREAVREAKQQLEHNRRLVDEGQLAPIDIVAAETQVANYELAVYDALNIVTQAENALKNLIAPNKEAVIWRESITPVESIRMTVPDLTLTDALNSALENRPELDANETQRSINKVDQRYFRDQKKPQIDLVTSYTMAGAAGTLNGDAANPLSGNTVLFNTIIDRLNTISAGTNPTLPPIPPVVPTTQSLPDHLIGGYGNSIGNMFANRYPTFRVGVQFNLPIFGNKTAGAQLGRTLVEADKLEDQRQQIEQNIQVDVRNSLQALRTAEARLRAAGIARANSERQYESERRKLDEGQSDIYKVLERQTALTAARSQELRAQTELNKAIAELERATGISLEKNNISTKDK